ncbi:phenol hydroxylase [Corynebacterium sp. HS2168-gen11]|uniref:phenol hydroxylase n=1 Tax=Corynebacterium sp. HS2168-gen11 TaxID=2974027 RepID=UPI00216ADDA7|nr:phenol hydroxylase [Corynebacterium sp. HS2168-gen11]MCS4536143.1 phenol hydroxylase [Corynebacterium sp. HS2168-gen11]
MTHPTILSDSILDKWLDHQAKQRSKWREFWHGYITYPKQWARRFWQFLLTTPGKMTAMVAIISLCTLISGINMSHITNQRRLDSQTLLSTTEPMSYMAQNLYSSLSYADTAASSGFVLAGAHTDNNRTDYATAYQHAAWALANTAAGISDPHSREMQLITQINQQLPIYTGLVETAWANNRQQNPVAVAYMSEASSLMREQMLPAADELYKLTNLKVDKQQLQLATPPWQPLAGLIGTLLVLIAAQIWLAHTTNRRLNKGIGAGFLIMLLTTCWISTTTLLAWKATEDTYTQTAAPLEHLIDARIAAQQARTTEMLALVWRQSLIQTNNTYQNTTTLIRETLKEFPNESEPAQAALLGWERTHNALVETLTNGDYEHAQTIVLTTAGTNNYELLDDALATLIDHTRETMRNRLADDTTSSTTAPLLFILSILATLSYWIGIRPRLQEYL